LPSEAVARVLTSQDPAFRAGDIVVVHDFWRDHAVRKGNALRKLDPTAAPVQTALGVMGIWPGQGLTRTRAAAGGSSYAKGLGIWSMGHSGETSLSGGGAWTYW